MSESSQWGLIGPGNVGHELMRQLSQDYVSDRLKLETTPSFILRSSGLVSLGGQPVDNGGTLEDVKEFPEVTFITMPSSDDGEVAKSYISHILERGKIAVTAEKGALANHFDFLNAKSDNFARLGVNATVGGGTRLVEQVRGYATDPDNITQMHLALNGTLSAIMSWVGPPQGSGMSLGQAVQQAVELGYAEPGSSTPHDVIKGEAEGDIPKKTAILFNRLGLADEVLDWKKLKFDLDGDEISRTVEEARMRRFIVSLYSSMYQEKNNKCPEENIIGGFNIDFEGWRLVGGFRNIDRNPLFIDLTNMNGPSNGFVIGLGPDESDGVYRLGGPGAGVRPTANTMLDDYIAIREKI